MSAPPSIDPTSVWSLDRLGRVPDSRRPEGFAEPGLEPLLLSGPEWRNEATEIFAWYGQPPGLGPFPAMVLVHGGGGTAFPDWVRLWNRRGYAAIAIDTCGCTAGGVHGQRPRHPRGGPPGWGGATLLEDPLPDQWPWHATAAAILANSWLRAQEAIDPQRIGLTGISWGGVISCWAGSVDHRFACAAPVYGCGFLQRNPGFPSELAQQPERREAFLAQWDPARFLPSAALPSLWVNGTTDFAFPLDAWDLSAALPTWPALRSVQPGMIHGQEQGASPREILAFCEHHLRGGPELPAIGPAQREDGRLVASLEHVGAIRSAELVYTTDQGPINQRRWLVAPAERSDDRLQAELPTDCSAALLSLRTLDALVFSSRPWWA